MLPQKRVSAGCRTRPTSGIVNGLTGVAHRSSDVNKFEKNSSIVFCKIRINPKRNDLGEQVMSEALDLFLAVFKEAEFKANAKIVQFPGFARRDRTPTKKFQVDETFSRFFVLNH